MVASDRCTPLAGLAGSGPGGLSGWAGCRHFFHVGAPNRFIAAPCPGLLVGFGRFRALRPLVGRLPMGVEGLFRAKRTAIDALIWAHFPPELATPRHTRNHQHQPHPNPGPSLGLPLWRLISPLLFIRVIDNTHWLM